MFTVYSEKDLTKFWTQFITNSRYGGVPECASVSGLPCNAYNVCLVLVPNGYHLTPEIV